jgi:hypothetical protein
LLHGGDTHFVLQEEGLIDKYLGVNIKKIDANTFELAQPFLIKQIRTFLGIADGKTNKKAHSSWEAFLKQRSSRGFKKV